MTVSNKYAQKPASAIEPGTFTRHDEVEKVHIVAPDSATIGLHVEQGKSQFDDPVTVPAPTTDLHAATKKYVDDNGTPNSVTLTGNQTVAGIKTFSSMPVLPIPGPYADDAAAATGGVALHNLYYVTTTGVVKVRMA